MKQDLIIKLKCGLELKPNIPTIPHHHVCQEYCFSPCPILPSTPCTVRKSWAQFSCYVYNNGKPDKPALLPSDVQGGLEMLQSRDLLTLFIRFKKIILTSHLLRIRKRIFMLQLRSSDLMMN